MRLSRVLPRPLFHATVVLCLILVFLTSAPLSDLAHGESQGYWHTRGSQILDGNDQPVRIAGINWYGFEAEDRVVHGLYARDYKVILDSVRAHGYNTVRIPFSSQMIAEPIIPATISYNNGIAPMNLDLEGLNSLQVLDKIVDYARQIGLRIILDNHRSEAGNSAQESGLWYTDQYPESKWIADWQMLARRYQKNPAVIGMDLRNEPHNAASGGACWDCGDPARDWHLAAERAGNAVLAINPHLLIFVEGTDVYGGDYTWWGGNLQGVARSPVKLRVEHQLVYSAHEYGPAEHAQRWFSPASTHASLAEHFRANWGYISEENLAPVWIGEFGTGNAPADVENALPGTQGQWFQALVGYLRSDPRIGWTYWALNGNDAYGLLDKEFNLKPVSAEKQAALASIQSPLPEARVSTASQPALLDRPNPRR